MRRLSCLLLLTMNASVLLAHPSSGIVVDGTGDIFFQDAVGRCIWKIDPDGHLAKFHTQVGGHWLAIDPLGRFSRSDPKLVERITPDGVTPALIVADGGAPITICGDGNLYYGLALLEGGKVGVGVTRILPSGRKQVVSDKLNA